jgi:hypothetical protein
MNIVFWHTNINQWGQFMKIFKNKFALVTGASSGMGIDYAHLLAE